MARTAAEKRAYNREWARKFRLEHPEQHAENLRKQTIKARARRAADPEKYRAYGTRWARNWRTRHPENYARASRKGRNQPEPTRTKPIGCECCGRVMPLCLDHCHTSGSFRGWLCRQCNTGLGLIGDTLASAQQLIDYLGKNNAVKI